MNADQLKAFEAFFAEHEANVALKPSGEFRLAIMDIARYSCEFGLQLRAAEVEKLREDVQQAQQGSGAEAYDIACEDMESWWAKRVKEGKDPGTQGSLVDGIAWLRSYTEKCEAEVSRLTKELAEVRNAALTLRAEEADLIRQWYNSIDDTNPKYLEHADNTLYQRVVAYLESKEPATPTEGGK